MDGRRLRLGHNEIDLDKIRHIVVVVAGRAAAGVDCASQLPIVTMEMAIHIKQHFAIVNDLVSNIQALIFQLAEYWRRSKDNRALITSITQVGFIPIDEVHEFLDIFGLAILIVDVKSMFVRVDHYNWDSHPHDSHRVFVTD